MVNLRVYLSNRILYRFYPHRSLWEKKSSSFGKHSILIFELLVRWHEGLAKLFFVPITIGYS